MIGREIIRTGVTATYPWPDDCFIQGGKSGLVVTGVGKPNYVTAFVEAFPSDPQTFIRGEGNTVAEAEQAAWEKYQRLTGCAGHEFETRNYRNGGGFCKHCGMFKSDAFTAEELGEFCAECGTPTLWAVVDGKRYCDQHKRLDDWDRAFGRSAPVVAADKEDDR